MTPHLIVYEIAGQRRCVSVQSGLKYRIGSRPDSHIPVYGAGAPDVLCCFAYQKSGRIQILNDAGSVDHELGLPVELNVEATDITIFQPGHLLHAPPVSEREAGRLELSIGLERFVINAPSNQILVAGSAPDADIVLPFGPLYSIVLSWDGEEKMQLANIDNSERTEWQSGHSPWGQEENVVFPLAIGIGVNVVYLDCLPS